MEKITTICFDQRGELCNTIKELFEKKDYKQYIPIFTNNGYNIDWSIIGLEFEKLFGWSQLIDNKLYPICPDDLDWKTWVEIKPKIQKWIVWISQHIFHPKRMIVSKNTTDLVRLRIAVALLDKMELPRNYADEFFDNLIYTYWARKYVYNTYYYKHILKIPF